MPESPGTAATFDRAAFETELARGYGLMATRSFNAAAGAFEQAHLIGQRWTLPHTRSHVAILALGWQRRDAREVLGQIVRIAWSALFTWLWVPAGNVGSVRVGMLQRGVSARP